MPDKEGVLTIEMLFKPILDLDEKGVEKELRNTFKQLKTHLQKDFERELGEIPLDAPALDLRDFEKASEKLRKVYENTAREIAQANAVEAKTDREREQRAQRILVAQQSRVTELKQFLSLIRRGVEFSEVGGLEKFAAGISSAFGAATQHLTSLKKQLSDVDANAKIAQLTGEYKKLTEVRKLSNAQDEKEAKRVKENLTARRLVLDSLKSAYKEIGDAEGLARVDDLGKDLSRYSKTFDQLGKVQELGLLPRTAGKTGLSKDQLASMTVREKLLSNILANEDLLTVKRATSLKRQQLGIIRLREQHAKVLADIKDSEDFDKNRERLLLRIAELERSVAESRQKNYAKGSEEYARMVGNVRKLADTNDALFKLEESRRVGTGKAAAERRDALIDELTAVNEVKEAVRKAAEQEKKDRTEQDRVRKKLAEQKIFTPTEEDVKRAIDDKDVDLLKFYSAELGRANSIVVGLRREASTTAEQQAGLTRQSIDLTRQQAGVQSEISAIRKEDASAGTQTTRNQVDDLNRLLNTYGDFKGAFEDFSKLDSPILLRRTLADIQAQERALNDLETRYRKAGDAGIEVGNRQIVEIRAQRLALDELRFDAEKRLKLVSKQISADEELAAARKELSRVPSPLTTDGTILDADFDRLASQRLQTLTRVQSALKATGRIEDLGDIQGQIAQLKAAGTELGKLRAIQARPVPPALPAEGFDDRVTDRVKRLQAEIRALQYSATSLSQQSVSDLTALGDRIESIADQNKRLRTQAEKDRKATEKAQEQYKAFEKDLRPPVGPTAPLPALDLEELRDQAREAKTLLRQGDLLSDRQKDFLVDYRKRFSVVLAEHDKLLKREKKAQQDREKLRRDRVEADARLAETAPRELFGDVRDTGDLVLMKRFQTAASKTVAILTTMRRLYRGDRTELANLQKRIDLWERRSHAMGEAVKARRREAETARDYNREEIDRLNKLVETYDSLDKSTGRIRGTRDVAELQTLRKDINEEQRALIDLERRYRKTGEEGSAAFEEVTDRQAENRESLNALNKQIGRVSGGWAGLNNTARQFFRYALFYGGMYELISVFALLGREIISLEDQMKNLQAVTASTESDMVSMSTAVQNTALTTRFSAQEIAQATTLLGQAGVDPDEIAKVLQSTAEFASAVNASTETAADLITTFRDVYKELTPTAIADVLTKAVNISKLTAEDLKTVVSISGQTARDMQLSSEQYFAAVTTLRNAGIKASTVSTGLRQLLIDIFSSNATALKQLERRYAEIGEPLGREAIRQRFFGFTRSGNPLLSALEELQRLGISGPAEGQLSRLYEVRAMNVLRALIDNIDELREKESELGFGGAAAEAAAIRMESLQSKLTNLGAALTFFATELTAGPVSALKELTDAAIESISALTDLDLQLKSTGESGVASELIEGLGVGVLLGSVTRGGFARKAAAGVLGSSGAVGLGISAADQEAEPDLISAGLTAAGLALAAPGIKDLVFGKEGKGGVVRSVDRIKSGLNRVAGALKNLGFVGKILAALTAVTGTAYLASPAFQKTVNQAFDWLFDLPTEVVAWMLGIERAGTAVQEQLISQRKILERAVAEVEQEGAQFEQFDPNAAIGIGRVAADFRNAIVERDQRIGRVLEGLGRDSGLSGELLQTLASFEKDSRARIKGTDANKALLKAVSDVTGAQVEAVAGFGEELNKILSTEQALAKQASDLHAGLKNTFSGIEGLTDQEIEDADLLPVQEGFEALSQTLQDAIQFGGANDFSLLAEAATEFTESIFTAAEKRTREATDELARSDESIGAKLRENTVKHLVQLQKEGKFSEVEKGLRELIGAQKKYFPSLLDLTQELTRLFGEAEAALPGSDVLSRTVIGKPAGTGAFKPSNISDILKIGGKTPGAPFEDLIQQYAAQYNVDPRLLASLIGFESNFNPNAVSSKGARGLTQFVPATGARYGLFSDEDFKDPVKSIRAGAAHLRDLLYEFGQNPALALAAYNAGGGAVRKAGNQVPLFPETVDYVAKILAQVSGQPRNIAKQRGVEAVQLSKSSGTAFLSRVEEQYAETIDENREVAELELARMKKKVDSLDRELIQDLVSEESEHHLLFLKLREADNLEGFLKEDGQKVNIEKRLQAAYKELTGQLDHRATVEKSEALLSEKVQAEGRKAHVSALRIQLDELRRVGAPVEAYAAIRQRIADLEVATLREQQERLRTGGEAGKGKDSQVDQARIEAEIATKLQAVAKDVDAYGRARRKTDLAIIKSRQDLAASEARTAAESAILAGNYEEASQYLKEYVEAEKRITSTRYQQLQAIENTAEQAKEIEKFEARTSDTIKTTLDLLDKRLAAEKIRLRHQLELGVTTPAEALQLEQQTAAGITPSREQTLSQIQTQQESTGAVLEEQRLIEQTINGFLEQKGLSVATTNFLLEQQRDITLEIEESERRQAEFAGQKKQEVEGVAGTFGKGAIEQIESLEEALGGQLLAGVNEFTSALGDAARAGENLGDVFQSFFSDFLAQIATTIAQTLLLRAITSAFPGLGSILTPGAATGGVVKAATGGIISGSRGIDTNLGAIVGSDGKRKPILVTHEEAILPAGMVRQLGIPNVQAAIDRYNATGVAKLSQGGIIGRALQQSQSPETPVNVNIVNVPGNSVVEDYMYSPDGQEAILNVFETNPQRARRALGG